MPEPAETQGSRELLQVEDPEATEVFRECGSHPVYFTFASRNGVGTCPKKAPTELVEFK
jgi:hypothetical protein